MLPRLATDLTELLAAAADGSGSNATLRFVDDAAVAVAVVVRGYPAAPLTGDPIEGLDEAGSVEGVTVFHAGTRRDEAGTLRTSGGRVLVVTALGATIETARERAYGGVARISFAGMQHRHDIAAGIGVAAP